MLNKKYNASINYSKSALLLIEGDSQAAAEISKLKELYSTALRRQTEELQTEKNIWKTAFQKNEKNEKNRNQTEDEKFLKSEGDRSPSSVPLTGIDFAEFGLNSRIRTVSNGSIGSDGILETDGSNGNDGKNGNRGRKSKNKNGSKHGSKYGNGDGRDDEDGTDSTYDWVVGIGAVVAAVGIFTFLLVRTNQNN